MTDPDVQGTDHLLADTLRHHEPDIYVAWLRYRDELLQNGTWPGDGPDAASVRLALRCGFIRGWGARERHQGEP